MTRKVVLVGLVLIWLVLVIVLSCARHTTRGAPTQVSVLYMGLMLWTHGARARHARSARARIARYG